ncbi:MAG: AbrB/MazE/SpoVT family DNA-binding domain-containing protein [Bacteroidia bacterium]|nr:AbrB/MazE/SpoVT family DNA-binding domain-containing protein [Bacteroidia bacterium]
MEIPIIRIGNSKGIRLSKTVLEQYHITDKVDLVMEEDCIVIKPVTKPRTDWDEAFHRMHENGDDQMLIPDVFPDEEFEEWK